VQFQFNVGAMLKNWVAAVRVLGYSVFAVATETRHFSVFPQLLNSVLSTGLRGGDKTVCCCACTVGFLESSTSLIGFCAGIHAHKKNIYELYVLWSFRFLLLLIIFACFLPLQL